MLMTQSLQPSNSSLPTISHKNRNTNINVQEYLLQHSLQSGKKNNMKNIQLTPTREQLNEV